MHLSSSASAWVALLLVFLFTGTAGAVDPEARGDQEDEDWLEFYYQDPRPERVVAQLKDWAVDGTLDNQGARPALIGFLSQVIRANRDQLEGWYGDLQGLSPRHQQLLHTAMLFSRTEEADRILRGRFGERYERQKREVGKILELPLDARPTLDMLWGFYYATGSANAIRRIVLCFRMLEAPDNPEGVDVPEGFTPYYKVLPRSAFGSLVSNAERHPRVLSILETILEEDESLMRTEREGVYDILSELKPETYPPGQFRPDEDSGEEGSTPARDAAASEV